MVGELVLAALGSNLSLASASRRSRLGFNVMR